MSNFELFIKRSKINLEEYFKANNIRSDEELKEYCQVNNLGLPSKKYFFEKPIVNVVSEDKKDVVKKSATSKANQKNQKEEPTLDPVKPVKPKRQTRTRRTRKKKE